MSVGRVDAETATISALVTDEPLDVAALLRGASDPRLGGTAVFIGTVRSPNLGREVAYLDYEGFETMIESEMLSIATEAREAAAGDGQVAIAIAHRLGRVLPGEAAIVVAVAARHRAQALTMCAELVDACKARLPIWKLEVGPDGVGAYAPGTAVAAATL